MKKIIFLLLILIFVSGCGEIYKEVCFDNKCFQSESASTSVERSVGLMFRTSLDEDKAMLFEFESTGPYSFSMKNTKIPLDIIWISETLEIVDIQKDAQPCIKAACPSYNPDFPALYVLEINSNLTDKYGINVGDKVKIS